jgi:hypothetical protein
MGHLRNAYYISVRKAENKKLLGRCRWNDDMKWILNMRFFIINTEISHGFLYSLQANAVAVSHVILQLFTSTSYIVYYSDIQCYIK